MKFYNISAQTQVILPDDINSFIEYFNKSLTSVFGDIIGVINLPASVLTHNY